jgi:formate hydrogenlyase transcriptional activator
MGTVAEQPGVVATSISARYRALIRIAQAIRGHRNPHDLFQLLTSELRGALPFDGIVQFDEMANKVHWNHCREAPKHPGPVLDPEDTVAWWVYRNQQTLLVRDTEHETRFPAMMEMFRSFGIRSACAVPLTTAHRRLGSLCIASEIPDAYSAEDVLFFSLVADQIALATDDALNFEASQRTGERLQLLLDLSNRVMANLDLRDLLAEISASIRRVMQCDGVAVILPEPGEQSFRLHALDFPERKQRVDEIPAKIEGQSTIAEVFHSGRPLTLSGSGLADHLLAKREGIKALCQLPLPGRNRMLGVLSLGRLENVPFSSGEVEFLGQVANQFALAIENALAYGQIAELKDRLAQENLYLENEIRSELKFEEIIGQSAALRGVLSQIETVAPTDSTVLVYGDTGTGKELVARALHNLSSRASNAFVKLNCAAIPTGLLESELFGHERGAFTGAIAQRIGRFELAHNGTVFLDEIGEIPLELQPKLLRVLQEREFERLGGSRTIRSDARLIAATNRDLQSLVDQQKFRQDLFYRLNVFPIRVPALRERTEDIPLLVRHFAQQFSRRMNKHIDTIPAETMTALLRYDWPGNIRELQNVMERAVILSPGPTLKVSLADLKTRVDAPSTLAPGNIQTVLDNTERAQILHALDQSSGVVSGPEGAAARLGMKRSTLQSRMQKLGIRITRTSR